MKNTSRKNIRVRKQRADHAAGCRISTDERTRLYDELIELQQKSGMKVSLCAYTKNALLNYARLRRLEVMVRSHATHRFTADHAREQHEALLGILRECGSSS